jgi:hypothetical protein
MKLSENVLKIALVIALAVVVMYAINCIVAEKPHFFGQGLKEGFDDEFCEAAFTSPTTRVSFVSVSTLRYLDVNKQKVSNNLKLSPLRAGKRSWKMDRVIEREAVGVYPDTDRPDTCAVFLKTAESGNKKPYYLTADMSGVVNSAGATPIGGADNQVWYVLKLSPNTPGPNQKAMALLHKEVVQSLEKRSQSTNAKFYLIATSPKQFISPEAMYPPTRFLTTAADSEAVVTGDLYLTPTATINSVWEVRYITKGTVPKLKKFKPVVGVGAYPNQLPALRGKEGTFPSKYGAFMPSFLRILNRTWWSPGAMNRVSGQSPMFQITVNLEKPNYTTDVHATGTVTIKLIDGATADYSKPENNKDISKELNQKVIPPISVKSVGDDMIAGVNNTKSSKWTPQTGFSPNVTYTVILKLLPKSAPEMGTPDVPLMQGWLITQTKEMYQPAKSSVRPLCAVTRTGIVQNIMGVCEALLPEMKFNQFMLKHGFASVNSKNNFNLSQNMAKASNFNPPPKNWVRYLKPDWLNYYSYGDPNTTPLGGPDARILGSAEVSTINQCASMCEGRTLLSTSDITGTNAATGDKLTAAQVGEYCNRFEYKVPDVGVFSNGASQNPSQKGTCVLGSLGSWAPSGVAAQPGKLPPIVGVVRRFPKTGLLGANREKYQQIGGVGTTLVGGPDLIVKESFEDGTPAIPDMFEHFETVGSMDECASLCSKDMACREFDYDPITGECQARTHSTPTRTSATRADQDRSFQYIGARDQLTKPNKDIYSEFPAGTSLLSGQHQIIDASGNVTTVGITASNIDDCANRCNKAEINCDRFTFDAQNRKCYLQTMGQEKFDEQSTFYSAMKNDFIPFLDTKYTVDGVQYNGKKVRFSKYYSSVFSGGNPVPNLGEQRVNNVATVNDCAEQCAKNTYCDIAAYDATNKTCNQFLGASNAKNMITPSGAPQQMVFMKKPSPTAILHAPYKKKFHTP